MVFAKILASFSSSKDRAPVTVITLPSAMKRAYRVSTLGNTSTSILPSESLSCTKAILSPARVFFIVIPVTLPHRVTVWPSL